MKKNNVKNTFLIHKRTLRLLNQYVPGKVFQCGISAVFDSLSPFANVWMFARLINELATQRRSEVIWKWAALTVLVTAVLEIIRILIKRWQSGLNELHNPMKNRLFNEKFFSMDYADVDNQTVRDKLSQIHQNENWSNLGLNNALENMQNCLKAILGIIGAVALTVGLFLQKVPQTESFLQWLNSPLCIVVLLIAMAITLLISQRANHHYNQKVTELANSATFSNRVWFGLFKVVREAERRLDIRTYKQESTAYMLKLDDTAFAPGKAFDRLDRGRYGITVSVSEALGAAYTGFVYVFACMKAWAGAFGAGMVTQYVGAITTLSGNISLLINSLDKMQSNSSFLELTFELLDTPNSMYQGSLTTEKRSDRKYEVEFKNVSFKYPGSKNWALQNVNIKFQVGKRLAIVGENGSGKTTFIKLLCRLYDPQEGEILLNGIDIRKYRYDDYMNIFSVVFQDFQLICQPLGANVAGSMHYDAQRVYKALSQAGFKERLNGMKNGLDTMLYKNLSQDGVDISGGEAQKIAIARALYKNAPFIILDEPTAALDPLAEAEIYSKFDGITGDRTAIYISHRLSSCKFCDEIAVFHNGAVIQKGSHENLVANKDGKYYELWNAQAQYYTK